MKKNNFLTKAFTLLFVLLFNLTGARAIVTHTACDGTVQNTIVPVDGSHVGDNTNNGWSYTNEDTYIRSQFIIPESELSIMTGGQISTMYFHAVEDVVNWYRESEFDVYVSETDLTTISSYQTWDNLRKVYSGNLAINGHQLIITFDSSIQYTGKNLLIGIRQTGHQRHYGPCTFYGQTRTGASIGSYVTDENSNGTPQQQNFVPKTTFIYTPGFIPTNVEVATEVITRTDITDNPKAINATVSWQGTADRYVIRYRTKRPIYSADFNSSNSLSGWTIRKAASGAYGDGWIRENNMMASYSWHANANGQGGQAYTADNWLISPALELGGILKFNVAAISAWHDIYEVKVSTTGIAEADFTEEIRPLTPGIKGIQDFDLEKYKGQTGYIAIHHKNYDGYYLDIDDFELSSGHTWKKDSTTEKSIVLRNLLPDVEYEYVVIGVKNNVRGETENKSFTTPHVPDIILPDAEDNEDLIYDVAGKTYNAYLEKRSFVDNGIWNTFSVPFNVTIDNNSPFKDALIYTVRDRSSYDNGGTLVLRIDPLSTTPTTTLTAGTPYLITWEGAKTVYEPNFKNVTFTTATRPVTGGISNGTSIMFIPNFNLLKYTQEDQSILFLNNNHLYYVGNGSRIKPQRAYFKVSGGNGVKGIAFEICEDDADGINGVNANLNGSENIYNVAGQRLGKMQKGINIVNGKKIIIK